MTVTMAFIARRSNVSPATVSRVLRGKGAGFISAETRGRVLEVAAQLGYVPARGGTGKVAERMGVVAAWIRNPNAPFYAGIVRLLQRRAAAEGSDLILSGFIDEGGEPDFEHGLPRAVNPGVWRVDGIIGVDCPQRVRAYLKRAQARGRAAGVVAAGSEGIEGLDCVTFDPHVGAEAATQHLLKCGRKRIVHLTGASSIESVRLAREESYVRVMGAAGLEPRVIRARDETRGAGRACIREVIGRGENFDAVFCLNDDLAIGAYRGLRDEGRCVPVDVAMVGYDSIEDTEYLDVPLTSVWQDPEVLVSKAWELLWRRIAEPQSETVSVVLAPKLVVRESCGGAS